MKKSKKIFSRIMTGISALIFVFGFAIFMSVFFASSGSIPSVLGFSVMQVRTGSMTPEIEPGDVIIVKKVDPSSLEVGDIISFYSTDETIKGIPNTHRIISIERTVGGSYHYTTKGDANELPDPEFVSDINLVGKMISDIGSASGTVLSVLRNPKIIFIFIVLPLIFICFSEAYTLVAMVVENKIAKSRDDSDVEAGQN